MEVPQMTMDFLFLVLSVKGGNCNFIHVCCSMSFLPSIMKNQFFPDPDECNGFDSLSLLFNSLFH